MKKTKKSYKNILAIAIVGLLAIFLFQLITKKQNQVTPTPIPNNQNSTILSPAMKTNLSKTYHSDFLEITIDIPNGFTLKEQLPEVLLMKNSDVITIHLVGTNKIYKTIDEFLDDVFNTYNGPKNITRNKVTINGKVAEIVKVEYPQNPENNNKAYYFYINNGFYHIYTKSPDLYSDLDQIARSFRYEP